MPSGCHFSHLVCFHAGIPEQEMSFWDGKLVPLARQCFSRLPGALFDPAFLSLSDLVSCLVSLLPPSTGTETDPAVDAQRTNEQTNRSPPRSRHRSGRKLVWTPDRPHPAQGAPFSFCSPHPLTHSLSLEAFILLLPDRNNCNNNFISTLC